MALKSKIRAWDGKSAEYMVTVFAEYNKQRLFLNSLVKMLSDDTLQSGATWLLKAWVDSGEALQAHHVQQICSQLLNLHHWQAKLHILQCMSAMQISPACEAQVYHFLRLNLTDQNKFVRAWCYNGLYLLAAQYPKYKLETEQFFELAMRDEAASVKARIRQISKITKGR